MCISYSDGACSGPTCCRKAHKEMRGLLGHVLHGCQNIPVVFSKRLLRVLCGHFEFRHLEGHERFFQSAIPEAQCPPFSQQLQPIFGLWQLQHNTNRLPFICKGLPLLLRLVQLIDSLEELRLRETQACKPSQPCRR